MAVLKLTSEDALYYEWQPPAREGAASFVFVNPITGDVALWNGRIVPALTEAGFGALVYNFRIERLEASPTVSSKLNTVTQILLVVATVLHHGPLPLPPARAEYGSVDPETRDGEELGIKAITTESLLTLDKILSKLDLSVAHHDVHEAFEPCDHCEKVIHDLASLSTVEGSGEQHGGPPGQMPRRSIEHRSGLWADRG